MKTFHIPLIDRVLYIYVGHDEWVAWFQATIKAGAKPDEYNTIDTRPGEGAGRSCGRRIWVYNLNDRQCLLHELVHYIQNLMEQLCVTDEEFRCILSGWLIDHVMQWRDKEITK